MAQSGNRVYPNLQVQVFVSYARADAAVRATLISKLGDPALDQVTIFWIDEEGDLGTTWEQVLNEQLGSCPIILLIVTKAFLQSRYCMEVELPAAVARYRSGRARVVFVRLIEEPVTGTLLEELEPWPSSGPLGQGPD
jgi:hypothetical protein